MRAEIEAGIDAVPTLLRDLPRAFRRLLVFVPRSDPDERRRGDRSGRDEERQGPFGIRFVASSGEFFRRAESQDGRYHSGGSGQCGTPQRRRRAQRPQRTGLAKPEHEQDRNHDDRLGTRVEHDTQTRCTKKKKGRGIETDEIAATQDDVSDRRCITILPLIERQMRNQVEIGDSAQSQSRTEPPEVSSVGGDDYSQ